MHRGYNLTGVSFMGDTSAFSNLGARISENHQVAVKRTLNAYVSGEGKIDGSKLQEHWFPQIKADVFLSHSHRDEALAKTIAGWLKKKFGLETFIDSCVWGYSEELLKQVDDEYCLNPGGETYSYEKRNGSTSHIYMMLSTALGMMIDNTECLFFLNTPNALSSDEAVSKTQSPWIYSEIAMTHIVRRKTPQQHRSLIKLAENTLKRKIALAHLTIEYEVRTTSLTSITGDILSEWGKAYAAQGGQALDVLYQIT